MAGKKVNGKTRGTSLIFCGCSSKTIPLLVRVTGSANWYGDLVNDSERDKHRWYAHQVEYLRDSHLIKGMCPGCGRFFTIKFVDQQDGVNYNFYGEWILEQIILHHPEKITIKSKDNKVRVATDIAEF